MPKRFLLAAILLILVPVGILVIRATAPDGGDRSSSTPGEGPISGVADEDRPGERGHTADGDRATLVGHPGAQPTGPGQQDRGGEGTTWIRLRDESGDPVAGWKVMAGPSRGFGPSRRHQPISGTTDEQGLLDCSLAVPVYDLRVTSPTGTTFKASPPYATTRESSGRYLDVVVPRLIRVRGHFRRSAGNQPRVNVLVEATKDKSASLHEFGTRLHVYSEFGEASETWTMAVVEEDGTFTLELSPGLWRVDVGKDSAWSVELDLTRNRIPGPITLAHATDITAEPTQVRFRPPQWSPLPAGLEARALGESRDTPPQSTDPGVTYVAASAILHLRSEEGGGDRRFDTWSDWNWTCEVSNDDGVLLRTPFEAGKPLDLDLGSLSAGALWVPLAQPLVGWGFIFDADDGRTLWRCKFLETQGLAIPRRVLESGAGNLVIRKDGRGGVAAGPYALPWSSFTGSVPPVSVAQPHGFTIDLEGDIPPVSGWTVDIATEVRSLLEPSKPSDRFDVPTRLRVFDHPRLGTFHRAPDRKVRVVLRDAQERPLRSVDLPPGGSRVILDLSEVERPAPPRELRLRVRRGADGLLVPLEQVMVNGHDLIEDNEGAAWGTAHVPAAAEHVAVTVGTAGRWELELLAIPLSQGPLSVRLPPLRSVALALESPDGSPLANARVVAEGQSAGLGTRWRAAPHLSGYTMSDARGHVDLHGIPEGPFSIRIRSSCGAPTMVARVEGGSRVRKTIVLRPR